MCSEFTEPSRKIGCASLDSICHDCLSRVLQRGLLSPLGPTKLAGSLHFPHTIDIPSNFLCRLSLQIYQVKQLITEKIGVPPSHFHLRFSGTQLEEMVKLLDYSVKSGSLLFMDARPERWFMTGGASLGSQHLHPSGLGRKPRW